MTYRMFRHPRNKLGYIIENKFKKNKVLTHEFHICIDYLVSNLEKYCVGEVIEVDDYIAVYQCKIKESFRHAIAKKEHIIVADVIPTKVKVEGDGYSGVFTARRINKGWQFTDQSNNVLSTGWGRAECSGKIETCGFPSPTYRETAAEMLTAVKKARPKIIIKSYLRKPE